MSQFLTLIKSRIDRDSNQRWISLYRCACGKEKKIRDADISSGRTVSCGCYSAQLNRENKKTHGQSNTREYKIWVGMHTRCSNSKRAGFKDYGGRGISVCARWDKFENFIEDMGRPSPQQSIDRIDGNGNYEPGNCRWATRGEQSRNKRSNVVLTINGKTKILSDWCRDFKINISTVKTRVGSGDSWEVALTAPLKRRYRDT